MSDLAGAVSKLRKDIRRGGSDSDRPPVAELENALLNSLQGERGLVCVDGGDLKEERFVRLADLLCHLCAWNGVRSLGRVLPHTPHHILGRSRMWWLAPWQVRRGPHGVD